jgi:hypothetical protein
MGEFELSGFSLPRKGPTSIDDKTVAKMGHPVEVVWSDVGQPPGGKAKTVENVAGRRWMGETLGILRFAQDDGRNVQRHEQQSGGWVMVYIPPIPPHMLARTQIRKVRDGWGDKAVACK